MRPSRFITFGIASVALSVTTAPVWASCSGAAAPAALESFNSNPGAWMGANGKARDIGAQVRALAAQAVNAKDPAFGKNLGAALGSASSDTGKSIGASLKGLVNSCSDPKDPGDAPDKKYISDNILVSLASNTAANVAYGTGEGPQTASTGGGGGGAGGGGAGGGGGTGVGATGAGLPSGGSNGGGSPTGGTTATNTSPAASPTGSAGSTGATGVSPAS